MNRNDHLHFARLGVQVALAHAFASREPAASTDLAMQDARISEAISLLADVMMSVAEHRRANGPLDKDVERIADVDFIEEDEQ